MKNSLITNIRTFLWKLLGEDYLKYLQHQTSLYSEDASFVRYGTKSYDNGSKVWFWSKNPKLEFGKYCSIANDVHFVLDSGYHSLDHIASFPLINQIDKNFKTKDSIKEKLEGEKTSICLGHDVWLGVNVTVLPGVKIGNGAICLAGSVVSKDVQAYSIVGGVPAKLVKYRFKDEYIENLQKIQWWNWTEREIEENINDFYLPIENFCEKYLN